MSVTVKQQVEGHFLEYFYGYFSEKFHSSFIFSLSDRRTYIYADLFIYLYRKGSWQHKCDYSICAAKRIWGLQREVLKWIWI